ncbi:hypothetical protein HDV63DRAFT_409597 [Trichoderma sp. SZMC 28014]
MSSNSMTKYSELIAAGRAVYAAQFRGIELNSGKSLPTLEPWYYTAYDPPSEPCMPSEQIQEAMGQANHPHKDYVLIQAADSGSTSPQTPYQNYVHKDGKAILYYSRCYQGHSWGSAEISQPCGRRRWLFALLGTVHGKGPARMLGDYPDMFGRKYISRAHVVDLDGLPAFYWILDEVPPPSPPPSLPPPDRPLSRRNGGI